AEFAIEPLAEQPYLEALSPAQELAEDAAQAQPADSIEPVAEPLVLEEPALDEDDLDQPAAAQEEPVAAVPLAPETPLEQDDSLQAEPLVAARQWVEETSQPDLDPLLLKIFRAETQTHIGQINGFLDRSEHELPCPLSDGLQRALHTLKGSAHMAGIQPIAVLATPLEKLAKDFKGNLIPADHAVIELLRDAVSMLEAWLERTDAASAAPVPG